MRYIRTHTQKKTVGRHEQWMISIERGDVVRALLLLRGRSDLPINDTHMSSIRVVLQSWIGSTIGNARAASEESPLSPTCVAQIFVTCKEAKTPPIHPTLSPVVPGAFEGGQ